jgi:hypothetical protein
MQPNQPLMPTSPTPFSTGPSRAGGSGSPLIIFVAVLGIGAVAFAILTLVF